MSKNLEFSTNAYETILSKMSKESKQSKNYLRVIKFAIHLAYTAIIQAKEKLDDAIQQSKDTLSERLAIEKNRELISAHEQYVTAEKKTLNGLIQYIQDKEINTLMTNYMIPPTDHDLRLFECAKIKAPYMTDDEWLMYADPFSKNYQLISCFQYLAKQYNKDIHLPKEYNPVIIKNEILSFMEKAKVAVSYLDIPDKAPNRYTCLEFYQNFDGGELDTQINTINEGMLQFVPEKYLSIKDELKKASNHALANDCVRLSSRIDVFISRNNALFDKPEEITEDVYNTAEELISKGMNAKKGDE